MTKKNPADNEPTLPELTEEEHARLKAQFGHDPAQLAEAEFFARLEVQMSKTRALLDRIRRLKDKKDSAGDGTPE